MPTTVSVTVTQQENYRFEVDFGGAIEKLIADEPPPLGQAAGPAPVHLLMAAIANCLSSSLFFALGKFKQNAGGIKTTASCVVERNEHNRLRVQQVDVELRLGQTGSSIAYLERILEQFESFCTVTQSVQSGVPVKVSVIDGDGARLK